MLRRSRQYLPLREISESKKARLTNLDVSKKNQADHLANKAAVSEIDKINALIAYTVSGKSEGKFNTG